MTDQMRRLAQTMQEGVQAETRPMQDIAAQAVRVMLDLGNRMLAALLPLAPPVQLAPDVARPYGPRA
ncbi:hypothetical protein [Roseiflexus sp.]|uniref:hypothetical protein n=1 Tax=Roseiflexus sp. TaxID=2562120 RepID=UPI00398AEBBF